MMARNRKGRSGPLLTTHPRLASRLRHHQDRRAHSGALGGAGAGLSGRCEGALRGVFNLASRHFNDHIRQGRRAASEVLDGSYNVAAFDHDVRICLDRMLRLPREFGAVSVDFFDGILDGSPIGSVSSDVEVEVDSARRAEATVRLLPAFRGFAPLVLPLFAVGGSAEPIESARFVVRDGSRLALAVKIPDRQPLGTYTAAIVDAQTQEPGGFVTIKIFG